MNAQQFFIILCLAGLMSALPIPNLPPTTSSPRHVTSSACVTSRDHSAGTCEADGPAGVPCGTGPYWLTPCAGCRPGAVIGPGHPLYQTVATPTANPQCQLDRLKVMESDLKYIIVQSTNLGRKDDRTDSVKKLITLAHGYGIPTTFKCRQGQNVAEWIQAGLVTFAAHWEEVWTAENQLMREIDDPEDCRISRATNDTRKNIGDMLCQISTELSHDPTDTCAQSYTGSGACHAPSTSSVGMTSENADVMDLWARDRVVNFYFQKFIRKAKRLLRKRIL